MNTKGKFKIVRKTMPQIPLGFILAEWVFVSLLFLFAVWWLKYKRKPPQAQPGEKQTVQEEPPHAEVPAPEAPPPGGTPGLPTWKHCTGCGTYAHSADQQCPCSGQYRLVSLSQAARVFTVQWAAQEAIPEAERDMFGAFVLRYEEHVNRFVPVDIALRLYHLGQTQDEVTR